MGIKRYVKNVYRYMKNNGFKQDGVTYVRVASVNNQDLLFDKNIIITGGSSGIGYAIAKRCIESGANVLITGRTEEKLIQSTEKLGSNAGYIVHDIKNIGESNYRSLFA